MSLVRKVGAPVGPLLPENVRDVLLQAKIEIAAKEIEVDHLGQLLSDERSKPPVEKIIEVEKVVEVESPTLIQTVANLENENRAIQNALQNLDTNTFLALKTSELRILALETTLEQTSLTASRRKAKLDKISETTQGRWPFMLKRTIRTLL